MLFLFREEKELAEIQSSGWHWVEDRVLQGRFKEEKARLADVFERCDYTELEFLELILGTWLEESVLPSLNRNIDSLRPTMAIDQQRRWHHSNKEELVRFFLRRFIEGLLKHEKHNLAVATLALMVKDLLGETRSAVLNRALALGYNELGDIITAIPNLILRFVILGSISCIDEHIFPHYGKIAFDMGILRHIPGKPFDYGILSYLLAQRLSLSQLPICLSICPTFLPST